MPDEVVEIRDGRPTGWWWAHNEIVDQIPLVGAVAFTVYCQLARHANSARRCWPSVPRIADQLELDRRTVQRALRRLETVGWIAIIRTKREDGSNAPAVFVLVDITGQGAALAPPSRGASAAPPAALPPPPPAAPVPPEQDLEDEQDSGNKSTVRKPAGWRTVPEGTPLSEARIQAAEDIGLAPDAIVTQWAAFLDHEFVRTHHDVDKSWRNWCREAKRRAPAEKRWTSPKTAGNLEALRRAAERIRKEGR